MKYIIHGSKNEMIVNFKLTLEWVAETNEPVSGSSHRQSMRDQGPWKRVETLLIRFGKLAPKPKVILKFSIIPILIVSQLEYCHILIKIMNNSRK